MKKLMELQESQIQARNTLINIGLGFVARDEMAGVIRSLIDDNVQMTRQMKEVLDLHSPVSQGDTYCTACEDPYPCDTVTALGVTYEG